MKRLILLPADFPVPFKDCPPGLFLHYNMVGMKTEYGTDEAYCSSGETFCKTEDNVTPLRSEWIECD